MLGNSFRTSLECTCIFEHYSLNIKNSLFTFLYQIQMVFEIGLRGSLADHVSFLVTISEITWQVTISLRFREFLTERGITATNLQLKI